MELSVNASNYSANQTRINNMVGTMNASKLQGVQYEKEGTVVGFGEKDVRYVINVKSFFNPTLTVKNSAGSTQVSDNYLKVKLSDDSVVSLTNDLTLGQENKPAGNGSTKERYTAVYTITISGEYRGLTAEKELKIVYYVPSLGWFQWW